MAIALMSAPASAEDVEASQRTFAEAMRAQAEGDLLSSIAILSALSRETEAPRVRLELGRALFITGQYRRAKAEFLKVYRQDLPYPVRRAVNVYLDEIDQRIGFVRPSVGLAIDSNPTRTAHSGVYDILGAPFIFDSTAEKAVGATYGLDVLHPIERRAEGQLQAVASVEGAVFDVQAANRIGGSAGLRYDDFRKRSRITVGWRGFHNQTFDASTRFIEYYRRWAPGRDRQISLQTSLELNRFPGRTYLDGQTVRGAVNYARDLGPDTTLNGGLGASISTISDALLPKQTLSGQLGVSRSFRKAKTNLIATAGLTSANFGATDPFFGARRHDLTRRLDVALYSAHPVWGLFPGAVLSYEQQTSSIDFYGYDRTGVSLDFRRRF